MWKAEPLPNRPWLPTKGSQSNTPLAGAMTEVLEAKGLRKVFGRKVAVNDGMLKVRGGEIVGLLGPNGAGKTTCFYMVVGFIRPTSGQIFFNGTEISRYPMYRRAQLGIAYLPQEASVFRKLTVEENIYAVLESRRELGKKEKKEKMENLLEELGIDRVRKQKAYTLSGGERRRTEIARALANDPKFLLLDEPFAGIDPKAVQEIKEIIQSLTNKGIGILITDHNVRDTMEITHRAYIIHNGNILYDGTRTEVLENPEVKKIYLGEDFRL